MRVRELFNAAGALTGSRLLLTAAMPWLLHHDLGLAAYLVAIGTDMADGAVARRTGTASASGAAWDAWVDKALHVNLAWTLAVDDVIPDPWLLAWFGREILQCAMIPLVIHRFRLERGPPPQTSILGRATAILLAVAVIVVLLGWDASVLTALTGIAGVGAGLHYGWIHLRYRPNASPG